MPSDSEKHGKSDAKRLFQDSDRRASLAGYERSTSRSDDRSEYDGFGDGCRKDQTSVGEIAGLGGVADRKDLVGTYQNSKYHRSCLGGLNATDGCRLVELVLVEEVDSIVTVVRRGISEVGNYSLYTLFSRVAVVPIRHIRYSGDLLQRF